MASDTPAAAGGGQFTALIPPNVSPLAPVICLLGWVGAQDKAMVKYAEMVAQHGYPSARSVQSMAGLFSPIARPRRQWALSLLHFLKDQQLSPPRSVFRAHALPRPQTPLPVCTPNVRPTPDTGTGCQWSPPLGWAAHPWCLGALTPVLP